jgi:hypothetical protein
MKVCWFSGRSRPSLASARQETEPAWSLRDHIPFSAAAIDIAAQSIASAVDAKIKTVEME